MSEHHHDQRRVAVADARRPDARCRHDHTGHGARWRYRGTGTTPRRSGTGSGGAWRWPSRSSCAARCSRELLGYSVPPASAWVAPVLGSVLYLYGGWPFLTGAVSELRASRPGMMLLVALAITVAFVASALTTLHVGGLDLDFWWELALLIVIMLLGHWLEMRALGQASSALDALAALLPDEAERLTPTGPAAGAARRPGLRGHRAGRSGGRVPADGTHRRRPRAPG